MSFDPDKTEKKLRDSILEYTDKDEIQSQLSEAFHIWKDDSYSITDYRSDDDIDDETFSKFFDWFVFDFRTFNNQKRIVEQYLDENLENLDDSELSVLRDWTDSCQSYFEVININSGESCLIEDIFTNEQYLIHDKAVSSRIKLLDLISARPLKTGEKYFFSGIVSLYPPIFKQIIKDHFMKEFDVFRSEHGTDVSATIFLKDFGYLIGNYVEDLVNHPQLISNDGEEFVVAVSEYEIIDKAPVTNILNNSVELIKIANPIDANEYFFIETIEDLPVNANIEIADKKMTLTCNTALKLTASKSFLESILGNFIKLKKDDIKKLNSYIEESKNKSYKLPKGFRSRKKFEGALDDFYTGWIDQPLEALNGSTPREALKSSEGRTLLENVLLDLEQLYESARKAGEPYYEVSKLRELLQKSLN